MPEGIEQAVGFDDDDLFYDWGPVKPYMDGDVLVIPVMDVIADSFWGSGLTAKSVGKALRRYSDATSIRLVINSPGGEVSEGVAIYNQLVGDSRPVESHVIGIAASMASIVMLAGDTRILSTGSMVMVHEPWAWTRGDRHDMRSGADMLDTVAESMLDIYEERTGADREELAELMQAETWLTADQARDLGFGTDVVSASDEAESEMMAAASADDSWNERRGAALARLAHRDERGDLHLPEQVQQRGPLGWRGPTLDVLDAAHAVARANGTATFAQALASVRGAQSGQRPAGRTAPKAKRQPKTPRAREAAPPPRQAEPVRPASPGGNTTESRPMNEEMLALLGLKPGATDDEIKAAIKAQKEAKAAAEAKAEEERLARIGIEAQAKAEAEIRAKAAAEAEAKAANEAHEAEVKSLLAGCIPSVHADLEQMCWSEVDGKRAPNLDGLNRAKSLAETVPGMRKDSLSGRSVQVETAAARGSDPAIAATDDDAPVIYRFRPGAPEINLTRITGLTMGAIRQRQAAMKRRAELREQFGS